MASLNKCMFIGNVGKDPVIKIAGVNNVKFATFNIALSEKHKDRSGQTVETTDWVPIKVWFPSLVDITEKYIHKGSQVYLECSYRTSTYQKDGETRYTYDLVANVIQLLGTKAENNALAQNRGSSPYQNRDSAPYQMGDAYEPQGGGVPDDMPF